MNYIPSFAGSAGHTRISSYNMIGVISSPPKETIGFQAVSIDGFISKLSSGVALKINYNSNMDPWIPRDKLFQAEAIIAPKISINGKYTISPAISGVYQSFSHNDSFIAPVALKSSLSFRSSILFNSNKFYIGYAVEAQPNLNFTFRNDDRTFIFAEYLQAGYTFQKDQDSKFAFTPQILVKRREILVFGEESQIAFINLNFRYKSLMAGLGNRQVMVGLQGERLKCIAVYQHFWGPLTNNYGHNIALSVRYQLTEKK